MWLLEFHVSFSVLCMLAFLGFRKVYQETIEKNGWKGNQKKRTFISGIWIFFTPILNLLTIGVLFMMILTKNENWESGEKESKTEEKGD